MVPHHPRAVALLQSDRRRAIIGLIQTFTKIFVQRDGDRFPGPSRHGRCAEERGITSAGPSTSTKAPTSQRDGTYHHNDIQCQPWRHFEPAVVAKGHRTPQPCCRMFGSCSRILTDVGGRSPYGVAQRRRHDHSNYKSSPGSSRTPILFVDCHDTSIRRSNY